MTDTIGYRPLPIETDDFLRLKTAAGDRDPNLRLDLDHTDVGEDYILVAAKGRVYGPAGYEPIRIATVRHAETEAGKPCWLVHHPSDGAMFEFPAVVDVANFLALGSARCCKRSYGTAWSVPGLIVGGALVGAPGSANAERDPGHPTTTQGSKEDVVRHGGAGSRGRYLPMLGDRAGE